MFLFILSIIIIHNKKNNIKLSSDLRNFAIFCLILDVIALVTKFHGFMYNLYTPNYLLFSTLICIMGIAQTSLLINTKIDENLSEDSFNLAIAFIVIELIFFFLNFNVILSKLVNIYYHKSKIRLPIRHNNYFNDFASMFEYDTRNDKF